MDTQDFDLLISKYSDDLMQLKEKWSECGIVTEEKKEDTRTKEEVSAKAEEETEAAPSYDEQPTEQEAEEEPSQAPDEDNMSDYPKAAPESYARFTARVFSGEGVYPVAGAKVPHSLQPSSEPLVCRTLPLTTQSWVLSLGQEDPLEKGKGCPLQCSCLENSMDYTVHGVTGSDMTECPSLSPVPHPSKMRGGPSQKDCTDAGLCAQLGTGPQTLPHQETQLSCCRYAGSGVWASPLNPTPTTRQVSPF